MFSFASSFEYDVIIQARKLVDVTVRNDQTLSRAKILQQQRDLLSMKRDNLAAELVTANLFHNKILIYIAAKNTLPKVRFMCAT